MCTTRQQGIVTYVTAEYLCFQKSAGVHYLISHRSSRHRMTPCLGSRDPIAAPPQSALLLGQVRFGGNNTPLSAVCTFHLGGAFKVHPGASALPLTSYVLDPVSLLARISSSNPPARIGGQLSICWDGVSFRAAHAGPVISLGVRLSWKVGVRKRLPAPDDFSTYAVSHQT